MNLFLSGIEPCHSLSSQDFLVESLIWRSDMEVVMTRNILFASSLIVTAIAGPSALATTPTLAIGALLVQSWQHVGTNDAETGADVSAMFPNLAGKVEYRRDGTYVFGDGSDRGLWTLSADGKRLVLASVTFEYGVELAVELLDASGLHVSSQMVSADGAKRTVVETFSPVGRFL